MNGNFEAALLAIAAQKREHEEKRQREFLAWLAAIGAQKRAEREFNAALARGNAS